MAKFIGNGTSFKKPSNEDTSNMIASLAKVMAIQNSTPTNIPSGNFLNGTGGAFLPTPQKVATLPSAPIMPQEKNLAEIIEMIKSGKMGAIDPLYKGMNPEQLVSNVQQGKNLGSKEIEGAIARYNSDNKAMGQNGAIKETIKSASVTSNQPEQNVSAQPPEQPENDFKNLALEYAKKYLSQDIAKPETAGNIGSDLLEHLKGKNIGGALNDVSKFADTSAYTNFGGDIAALFGKSGLSRQLYANSDKKKSEEKEALATYNKSMETRSKDMIDVYKMLSDLGIKKEELGLEEDRLDFDKEKFGKEFDFNKDKFEKEFQFNKDKWTKEFDLEGKKFSYEQRKDKIDQAFKEKELNKNTYIALSRLNEEKRHNKVSEGISQQNADSSTLKAANNKQNSKPLSGEAARVLGMAKNAKTAMMDVDKYGNQLITKPTAGYLNPILKTEFENSRNSAYEAVARLASGANVPDHEKKDLIKLIPTHEDYLIDSKTGSHLVADKTARLNSRIETMLQGIDPTGNFSESGKPVSKYKILSVKEK